MAAIESNFAVVFNSMSYVIRMGMTVCVLVMLLKMEYVASPPERIILKNPDLFIWSV